MSINRRALVANIAELVAIPSVSSTVPEKDMSNLGVINWLAERFSQRGFSIDVMKLPGYPEKANLIATLGQGDDGLVLAGHTDTVPFNERGWHSDPFRLKETNSHLIGLGTTDMKAFFAIVLAALDLIDLVKIKRPLVILATADEETTMAGARALVASGKPRGRYALIGEPTSMRPVRSHKGIMMESVSIQGSPGHSSDPAAGVNAIAGMNMVLTELEAWRNELSLIRNEDFPVPYPTVNFGYICGGDNPNRICDHCELHFDIRLLPGMDPEKIRRDLADRLAARLSDQPHSWQFTPLNAAAGPMSTPPESEIVRVVERLTGYRAEAANYCTEGTFLTALGMETLIFGPGSIEAAHQNNESIRLDMVTDMVRILASLVTKHCG